MMNSTDQFDAIVTEHYELLFRFAMSLTRTEADAQDLTQHTFSVWAMKGHQLRDRSKIKGWLFTTLHRAYLQRQRRRGRFPHYELDEVSEELPVVSPVEVNRLDSSQVLSALAKLDEIFQSAVSLFYLNDFSYKEIAAILEVPLGTVKSRITRGIAQLREILCDSHSPQRSRSERDLSPSRAPEPRGSFQNHKSVTAVFGSGFNSQGKN